MSLLSNTGRFTAAGAQVRLTAPVYPSAPILTVPGSLYYNSTTGRLNVSTGLAWDLVGSGSLVPAQTIEVSASFTDDTFPQFLTPQSAIAYVNANLTPVPGNPVLIQVYPGTYTTSTTISIPDDVQMVAVNSFGASSTIACTDSTVAVVLEMGNRTLVRGFRVVAAYTAAVTSNVLFRCNQTTGSVTECQFVGGATACLAVGNGLTTRSATMIVDNCASFPGTAGTTATAISSQNGAILACNTVSVNVATVAFDVRGELGQLVVSNGFSTACGTAVSVANVGGIERAEVFINGMQIGDIPDGGVGLSIGELGRAQVLGMNVILPHNRLSQHVVMSGATAQLLGSANTYELSLSDYNDSVLAVDSFTDTTTGDEGTRVVGQLAVGTVRHPAEAVFGGGDSYTNQMRAFREAAGGGFTDITPELSALGGAPVPIFDSTAVNNFFYVGMEDGTLTTTQFGGYKAEFGNGISINLGTGGLTWQYWNGSAWTAMNILWTQADAPHLPLAQDAFTLVGNVTDYQLRFNGVIRNTWQTTTVNGVTGFWARVFINTPITTIPTLDRVKLHTDRTEINADGFQEYFGLAQPFLRAPFDVNWFTGAANSPANQDLFLDDSTAVGRVENEFVTGALDRSGFVLELPEEIDTSRPLRLRIRYMVNNAASGNVRLQFRHGYNVDVTDDPNPVGTTISSVWEAAGTAPTVAPGRLGEEIVDLAIPTNAENRVRTISQDFDIATNRARRVNDGFGDILWLIVERVGTDAADTYVGNWTILQISPLYWAWNNGSYQLT